MSELSREEALYACMFKIMLWWRAKDVNGNEWEEAIAEGKRFSANLPPEIRTALAGGGGGEKAENVELMPKCPECRRADMVEPLVNLSKEDIPWTHACRRCHTGSGARGWFNPAATPWSAFGESWETYLERQREKSRVLESRLAEAENEKRRIHGLWESANSVYELQKAKLAAAEKRAEEAEEYNAGLQLAIDEQRKNMAGFIAERDDLKAELAEARSRNNGWVLEHNRVVVERDAALARAKELEADLELSESHRSTVQGRLASIARLAEGAQP